MVRAPAWANPGRAMTQSAANPQRSGRDPRRALAATKDECPVAGLRHPLFSVASTLIRSRASKECEAGGGRRGRARRTKIGWGSEGWEKGRRSPMHMYVWETIHAYSRRTCTYGRFICTYTLGPGKAHAHTNKSCARAPEAGQGGHLHAGFPFALAGGTGGSGRFRRVEARGAGG